MQEWDLREEGPLTKVKEESKGARKDGEEGQKEVETEKRAKKGNWERGKRRDIFVVEFNS